MKFYQFVGMILTGFSLMACTHSTPSSNATRKAHNSNSPHIVTAEALVEAPVSQVWQDWTTAEGLENFLGPKAFVEMKTNGRFEVWFLPDAPKGERGAEDGKLLGFQTERMMSFTWAMPPYMPEIKPHHTYVQVWFDNVSDQKTRVRLYHHGWGEGDKWDQGRAYFSTSWPEVMEAYQTRVLEKAP